MSAEKSLWRRNLPLIIIVILLATLPLVFIDGEFGGADGKAEVAITEIVPDYEPWFTPLWEPGGETESLLFALQAAFGASIIAYAFGYWKGQVQGRKERHSIKG